MKLKLNLNGYPKRYHKAINRIINEIGTSPETAYAMMLMTAMLMDLEPEDEKVVHMILVDCGVEDEVA